MAEQLPGQQTDCTIPKPVDPQLDFTSPAFDAAVALAAPGVTLPVPEAPLLDNVAKCAVLLPSEAATGAGAEVRRPLNAATSTEDAELEAELRAARRAKAAAMKQRAANTVTRAAASVRLGSLTDIMTAATLSGGPIAALARWQAEGARVTAVTRHAGGVRGRAVGRLIAFDRFLNLLMADVEESYAVMTHVRRVRPQAQKLLTQAAENLPQQQQEGEEAQQQQQQQQQNSASTHCRPGAQQRVRWCRKLEQRQRSLEQVLLVGDSIVLVSCRDGKG